MQPVKPYEYCATRLERRGMHPPTRAWVDALVEELDAAGVEALIHSAVSQPGRALFPSRIFENNHPEASTEAFDYLLNRLHDTGRPVLSWYALNHAAGVAEAHPDWRMVPLQGGKLPPPQDPDGGVFLCFNSPYGERLPLFCREVIELGFDGLWFDGSTFAVDGNRLPGCLCAFCRERFGKDTGKHLPRTVGWDDPVFRLWINWRYDRLMSVWKACLDAIHQVNPRATVCFNNYRRYGVGGWHTGIPLRPLGWDCILSGELDLQVFHGDFQMKMHRAAGCARGQDAWQALCDHWNLWVPDIEPLPVEQAAVACVAAGGQMWMGVGMPPGLITETLERAQQAMAPLLPYRDGEPIPYLSLWVSQQTQDFAGQDDPLPSWQSWHGVNELCQHAHLPLAHILYDAHLTAALDPAMHPILCAGNAVCVSDAQATILRQYVINGGILLAWGEFATADEWGQPRAQPPLDDLLGIRGRAPGTGSATWELLTPHLVTAADGPHLSWHGSPHTLADPTAEDVELLAQVVDHGAGSWDDCEGGGAAPARRPGLWQRRIGRGSVVYSGVDLGRSHIVAPTVRQVACFRALLSRLRTPPITLDGPLAVTLNARRRRPDCWIVHLHNAPGSVWRYPAHANSGELTPVSGLRLRLTRPLREAVSGLNGVPFEISDDGHIVSLPPLYRNDVVILRFTASISD